MEDKEIITIHDSLLVVTKDGILRRIYCPFPVRVVKSAELLREGEIYMVLSVRMGEVKLFYMIGNHIYTPAFFVILTSK